MPRILFVLLLLLPLTSVAENEEGRDKVIRLAASTTIEDSGLLPYLLFRFQKLHDYEIELSIVGSGRALRMGRTGAADLVWVHSPQSERVFVDQGYGLNRRTVMRNDFILAGPADDPGNVAAAGDILEALQIISRQGLLFLSRGDDSGTHKKELALWEQVGIDPYALEWYLESGAGMAASLAMAQNEGAYVLIDHATFAVHHGKGYKKLLEDPLNLYNPYSVIAVNPDRHEGVNLEGANMLIEWLCSEDGWNFIEGFTHKGAQLFYPVTMQSESGQ